MRKEWEGFKPGKWNETINVEEFITLNYTPYDGDESFLAGPTARTTECSDLCWHLSLLQQTRKA